MYDNIYTTEETAKILKIGTSTFRRLIEAGEAPTHTIVGKRKRFTHSRIMEWIEEMKSLIITSEMKGNECKKQKY
ncbi:DNA binding domain-containing protein, excisionase family [Bartonella apihabitans]|uniref:helix-turn-helix domain-containing protein n=1 Tax=Bartonella apihabitans TaxID=2750929 RepID=UPI0009C22428|nr:helix-turn-helix domain-containing protein [Bartonella apihabitans]AQT44836.1 DNA binding domain-containing protein, excisionase family [Bartonella apihabitans]